MDECNFIYAHKKSRAFRATISTELTNAQHNYVRVSYPESHPIPTTNMECRDRNSFEPYFPYDIHLWP
jgi:hypothetical protein